MTLFFCNLPQHAELWFMSYANQSPRRYHVWRVGQFA